MVTVIVFLALIVLVLAGAIASVVSHDGRGPRRPPTSHFVDHDFVAPRDRLGA